MKSSPFSILRDCQGVDKSGELGAGDEGMIGYAINEREDYMSMPL